MNRARRLQARWLSAVAAILTVAAALGGLLPDAHASALPQTCPPIPLDPAVWERACRRADEIDRQAGELLRAWPSTYTYYRPHPPYPGSTYQRPYPWELLGSPFLPDMPIRELDFMDIDPAPRGSDYSRLIRYYMTPLVFVPNYQESAPYLYGGQGPPVVAAWAAYLGRSVEGLRPEDLAGDGARRTIAAWLREAGYLVADTAGPGVPIAQQVSPRPRPGPPPPDPAVEARRFAWWVAHNSCAVALGRNMLVSQQMIPPDAYAIGIDRFDDPSMGLRDDLITIPGIQTLGNMGFASGNETMHNWDYLDSLLRDLQTQTPPVVAQPIFLDYAAALSVMRVAGGNISETRMDVAGAQLAAALGEFGRQLNRLEGLWRDRPRVDLRDCERYWQRGVPPDPWRQ